MCVTVVYFFPRMNRDLPTVFCFLLTGLGTLHSANQGFVDLSKYSRVIIKSNCTHCTKTDYILAGISQWFFASITRFDARWRWHLCSYQNESQDCHIECHLVYNNMGARTIYPICINNWKLYFTLSSTCALPNCKGFYVLRLISMLSKNATNVKLILMWQHCKQIQLVVRQLWRIPSGNRSQTRLLCVTNALQYCS